MYNVVDQLSTSINIPVTGIVIYRCDILSYDGNLLAMTPNISLLCLIMDGVDIVLYTYSLISLLHLIDIDIPTIENASSTYLISLVENDIICI